MTFENLNNSKIADCGQKQANIILIIKIKLIILYIIPNIWQLSIF